MSAHNQAINRGYGKAWRKCNNALAHTMHFQYFISSEYKNKYCNDQFSSRNFVERNLIILSESKNPRNKITLSFQFLNHILRALLCFVIWQLRYLFVQIRWEEARDYVNVIKIHSLPEPAAGPKILEFSCTQKESVFYVFVAVMSLVKILVFYRCHFYYFFYTWKINIQRAEERWRGSGKPALAFENVDFVDDVVIFVIVRINETRKVLYVKVLPRYYINK